MSIRYFIIRIFSSIPRSLSDIGKILGLLPFSGVTLIVFEIKSISLQVILERACCLSGCYVSRYTVFEFDKEKSNSNRQVQCAHRNTSIINSHKFIVNPARRDDTSIIDEILFSINPYL